MAHATEMPLVRNPEDLHKAELPQAEEFSFRPTRPHVAFVGWEQVLDAGGGPCLALGAERRLRQIARAVPIGAAEGPAADRARGAGRPLSAR